MEQNTTKDLQYDSQGKHGHKKITYMSLILVVKSFVFISIIITVLLMLVVGGVANAGITIEVYPSVGPNRHEVCIFGTCIPGDGPSWHSYRFNALMALEEGLHEFGEQSEPGWYQVATTIGPRDIISSDKFHSWRGIADPPNAFSEEFGNKIWFGVHILGNGDQFQFSNLSFDIKSTDSNNALDYSDSMNTFEYDLHRVGVDYGSDRVKGTEDDKIITSGPSMQIVDELIYVGAGVAFNTDNFPGTTDQEKLENTIDHIRGETPFTIAATYTLYDDISLPEGERQVIASGNASVIVNRTVPPEAMFSYSGTKYVDKPPYPRDAWPITGYFGWDMDANPMIIDPNVRGSTFSGKECSLFITFPPWDISLYPRETSTITVWDDYTNGNDKFDALVILVDHQGIEIHMRLYYDPDTWSSYTELPRYLPVTALDIGWLEITKKLPSGEVWKFESRNLTVTNVYIISGHVRTASGIGIPGVGLLGLPRDPKTDNDGYYEAWVDSGWSGTVIPQKADYTFELPSSTYNNVNVNLTEQNYTGTLRYTLTVNKPGTGTGTVRSEDGYINCGTECSESYVADTKVTLSATPDVGSVFSGWSGDCSGTNQQTRITMNADKSCIATFSSPNPVAFYYEAVVPPHMPIWWQGQNLREDPRVGDNPYWLSGKFGWDTASADGDVWLSRAAGFPIFEPEDLWYQDATILDNVPDDDWMRYVDVAEIDAYFGPSEVELLGWLDFELKYRDDVWSSSSLPMDLSMDGLLVGQITIGTFDNRNYVHAEITNLQNYVIPEPATLVLLGSGILLLAGLRKLHRTAK